MYRLFDCKEIKGSVSETIKASFDLDNYSQEDYYYLMEILRRLSLYGDVKNSEKAFGILVQHVENKWLKNSFDSNTWSLDGKPYSVESTKVAVIIAQLMGMGKLGQSAYFKLDQAFKTLQEQLLYESKT